MYSRTFLRIGLAALATALVTASAQAQVFRAYVASDGLDTNPCSLPQPCRLLPAALAAVASGGEIWMLDSANYNTAPVNITKSVTILAIPGALGSVVATSAANAINIDTAGVSVTLRNLVIVPVPGGGGVNGVSMTNGTRLTVDRCSISDFAVSGSIGTGGNGIYVVTGANVRVIDSIIRDGTNGLWLRNAGVVTISGSKVVGNSDTGIWSSNTVGFQSLTVEDTVVQGNTNGVTVQSLASGITVRAFIMRATVTGNSIGVGSLTGTGPTVVVLSNSMVSGNTSIGLLQSGAAVFESLGNNTVRRNNPDTQGTITTVSSI